MPSAHLAIDLGASSGRAMVGVLRDDPAKLELHEVHRFEHLPCATPTGPVWNLTGIWLEILSGLSASSAWCRDNRVELQSIGVDTWGVDWSLLGQGGELLALPHCYRDPQNAVACENVVERLGGFESLYDRTGIQLLPFNTLFQLAARVEVEPSLFDAAHRLVFLPDLFHYWLSGEVVTERSIASTSSMLNVQSADWDRALLEQLNLPTELLGPIVDAGTEVGIIRPEIAEATGAASSLKVIAPASHDTASAVAAAPTIESTSWAYLSSGTWSLLGAELKSPIFNSAARDVPFTNELGVGGTVRFLKNIAGLWLVQELRRELNRQGNKYTFAELMEHADQSEPGRTIVDPDWEPFAAPGEMDAKLRQFATATNQPVPESIGQLARCCLDSLAACYGRTFDQLEEVVGQKIEVLHLVGGGTKNRLLNQLTSSAIDRPVLAGPVEATAIGNLLVQAMGCGKLGGLADIREVVHRSFPLEEFQPTSSVNWSTLREKYNNVVSTTV